LTKKQPIHSSKSRLLLLGQFLLALFCWIQPLWSQPQTSTDVPAEAVTPTIQALLDGLMSDQAEASVRLNQARALLSDSQAHPKLIEILNKNNNTTAKIFICRAIASRSGEILPLNGSQVLPESFIDPLFKTLFSENTELSSWSAQAIASCQSHPVVERLRLLVADETQSLTYRLAGISALELMTGKEPVLALGALLNDKDPQIQNQAALSLASILGASKPVTAEQFTNQYQPQIQKMDDTSYLRWQLVLKQKQLLKMQQTLQASDTEIKNLRKWQQQAILADFNRLTDSPAKLELLKKYLTDQPDESLRISALLCANTWCKAANMQSDPIVQPLLELLTGFIVDANPKVRELTATALGLLAENAILTAPALLIQLTKEESPQTQAAMLETLGIFSHVPAAEQALKLLDSPEPDVVVQAARMLGKLCAAQSPPLQEGMVLQITQALAGSYQKPNVTVKVRQSLVEAMRKISSQEKYKKSASQYFNDLLHQTLQDKEPALRSSAVYAIANLLGPQSLAILIEQNKLLDDSDAAVRFAVIEAIRNYGGKELLPVLIQQLTKETNTSAMDTIQDAFLHILDNSKPEEYYQWIIDLQNANEKIQPLHERLILVMLEKIRQLKNNEGQTVDPKYEMEALSQLIRIYVRKGQYDTLIQTYTAMLALDQAAGLAHLMQTYEQLDLNDDVQLMGAGTLLAGVIVPIQQFPSPESKSQWDQRRLQVALRLIESQEKLLSLETGKENPQAIKLLSQLHKQLKDYPALDAPINQRRAKLQEFRTLLVPVPVSSDFRPKDSLRTGYIPRRASNEDSIVLTMGMASSH